MNSPRSGAVSITMNSIAAFVFNSVQFRIGSTSAVGLRWTSLTTIRAKCFTGIESMLRHIVSATPSRLDSYGTMTNAVTFDNTLIISSAVRVNVPTSGSVSITAALMSFPSEDLSLRSTIAGTPVANLRWVSSTSVSLKQPNAFGTSCSVLITSEIRKGCLAAVVSAEQHLVFGVLRTNAAATGSISTTVLGALFNAAPSTVRLRNGYSGTESSFWISDSSVSGKLESTQQLGLYIYLTSASQRKQTPVLDIRTEIVTSSSTGGLNADSTRTVVSVLYTAVFSSDSIQISRTSRENIPTTGSISVTILASNHGENTKFLSTPRVRLHKTGLQASIWISDSSVQGKYLSGTLKFLSFSSTQYSYKTSLSLGFSFDTPAASSGVAVNGPRTGSVSLTVVGSGGLFSAVAGRLGGTRSVCTSWRSDSSLVSKTAGNRLGASASTVSMGFLQYSSLTLSLSSDLQALSSLVRSNGFSSGAFSVSISGGGLFFVDKSVTARVLVTLATATIWVCYSPNHFGL